MVRQTIWATSGYSGISGASGFSGISGWSGYSGYSGQAATVGNILFATNESSDVGGYKVLSNTNDTSTYALTTASYGETLVGSFISGAFQNDTIVKGLRTLNVYVGSDKSTEAYFKVKIYKRNTAGTETEILPEQVDMLRPFDLKMYSFSLVGAIS